MSFTTELSLERSRDDVGYFYRWLGYTWGEHIGEWLELYGNRKGSYVHKVCIVAPRGHSKSTTVGVKLLHMALFDRFNNAPINAWLFSASRDTAIRRLAEIRGDLTKHPQLSKYLDTTRGGKTELYLTNGAVIRCTSVGSAIRGDHPGVVVLDDILLDAKKDLNLGQLRNWLRKVVMPMLDPKSSLFCVGTPMSMNDIYHTEMLGNDDWKTGVWSSIPNWDEWRADPENVKPIALWEELRPIDYLLEQKNSIGDLEFAQEYLCKVVDDESAVYPRNLIRKNLQINNVLEPDKRDDSRYVIGFDPSHGLGQDYSVMVVLRQDAEGYIHFVNMWRRNDFPPDKQADVLIEMTKRYGNCPVAAEDVGFQQMYESLLAQKGAMVDYRQSKVSNRTLKQGLLNRLRVWFERELVMFPFGSDDTRRIINVVLEELETHAWREGLIVDLGKHNDTTMALAHAIDQFTYRTPDMPVVMKTLKAGQWLGGSKGLPSVGSGIGGRVIRK